MCYSIDDFYHGVSKTINVHLQKVMGQLGYVEQAGHGVPVILKSYGKEAFKIREGNIVVTLRFGFPLQNEGNRYSALNDSQAKVLRAIAMDPAITTKEISKVVHLSTSRVSLLLKELKQLNKITRVGARKNGHWVVNYK